MKTKLLKMALCAVAMLPMGAWADDPQTIGQVAVLDFLAETSDNSTGLDAITNYNSTGFYLRGHNTTNGVKIPIRVTETSRTFNFSDGSSFSSKNYATLQAQTKNDYTSNPAVNADYADNNRLNIGFQTTVPGTIFIGFQTGSSSPTEDAKLRLAMNGIVVSETDYATVNKNSNVRCGVVEYTASEAGTFFIDAWATAANIYYIRFVPQQSISSYKLWTFTGSETNMTGADDYTKYIQNYDGLYFRLNTSRTATFSTASGYARVSPGYGFAPSGKLTLQGGALTADIATSNVKDVFNPFVTGNNTKNNSDRSVTFKTTKAGNVYVAFKSSSSASDRKASIFFKSDSESSFTEVASKYVSNNNQVMQYEATEGGIFIIASTSAIDIYAIKYVPYGEEDLTKGDVIDATTYWDFSQFQGHIDYSLTSSNSNVPNCSGLYMHVYSTHTITTKTSTISEAQTIGSKSYSGVTSSVFINGGAGTVSTNGYVASATENNVDAYGLNVNRAGTLYILVQTPNADRTFTFNFNGTDDATTQNVSASSIEKLSYHATGGGTIFFKAGGSFYLIAAAFIPDSEGSMAKEITISDAGYATFSAAQNYTMPSSLKAYIVSAVDDTKATLTEVTEIPACTGVILKGAGGSHTLTSAASTTVDVSSNQLKANMVDYVLPVNNGTYYNYTLAAGPVFKHVASEGAGTLVAGKAFLRTTVNVTTGARGFDLVFDDGDVTGISEVNAVASDNKFYNLQGVEVKAPAKGLYIVNGKKVVIK